MGILAIPASAVGTTEPALSLILSLFFGYPLAIVYRKYFFKKEPEKQHLFFAVSGLSVIVFNYGVGVWHSVLSVLVAYLICKFLAKSVLSVVLAFTFFMGHLLIGYLATESARYDITWTMPQCILTLRLIGLVWDVYDGNRPQENLTADQKTTALKEGPGLLEIFAFTHFFSSSLVGPQYPITKFRQFVNGEFCCPETGGPPNSLLPALRRLSIGILYLLMYLYGHALLPNEFFQGATFKEANLLMKYVYAFLWFRFIAFRYQAAWLVTEGSCIYSGLAYNGLDDQGHQRWDGLRNIRMQKFELGTTFQTVIESFNLNTNLWAAKYIFKRLRFLGNKTLSHVLTLGFLALWHGFHLGYFACFFYEFICVIAERQLPVLIARFPRFEEFIYETSTGRILGGIFGWTVKNLGCTWGFLPFGLIKKEKWFPVFRDMYFSGWIVLCLLWPLAFHTLIRVLPKPPKKEKGPSAEEKKTD